MKKLSWVLSALPGWLLTAALVVLCASSLLRYAEALPWLPHAMRSVNIGLLHQFATDLLIAMTLFGSVTASRAPMPRYCLFFGLVFSLFLLAASVGQVYVTFTHAGNVRSVFYLIPLCSLLMATVFLRRIRAAATSSGFYFPVSMGDGGIKMGVLLGATAFVLAALKQGIHYPLLAQYFFDSLDQFTLMTIPFLVLAGVVLNPQRRSGNLIPFALLALWYAAFAGIAPGKFIFALLIPGAMIFLALSLAGAKNIIFAEHKPIERLMMYGLVGVLFIGTFIQAFASFTEGAALAALMVGVASVWLFRQTGKNELAQIVTYSAVQSAGWLFTGAATMLWVRLLGDVSLVPGAWLTDKTGIMMMPGVLLLCLSVPVCAACYLIGPIAAILIASALLLPVAGTTDLQPIQLGVILLLSLALVKVLQTNRTGAPIYYPSFKRNHALLLMLLVLLLVAFMPALSQRLPLLLFGPGI
jgi:hypothetical protein